MSLELIVIGHIMIETIFLNNGEVIGPVLGSPASYSSVASSSLGIKTGLVTVIGEDMPFYIVNPIIESGVDTKGICIRGKDSRSTKLSYDKSGNKKIHYDKVAPAISFECIPEEYLNSLAFFICPIDFEVPLETIYELKKLNKLMMTDLGGYGGTVSTKHLSYGNSEDREIIGDIVSNFYIVKVSIEDCHYLFDDKIQPGEAVRIIHKSGAEIVIITLGEDGSMISYKGNIIDIPVIKTKVVDTTGAGDVYCAAFISEYLRTEDIYVSGLYASAATSILIEKTGGVISSRIPSDQMVRERLGDNKLC